MISFNQQYIVPCNVWEITAMISVQNENQFWFLMATFKKNYDRVALSYSLDFCP